MFTYGFTFESSEFIAFRNHVWDYQATKIQSLTITMPDLNKKQLVLALGGALFALLSILKFVSLLWGILISVGIACLISRKIL